MTNTPDFLKNSQQFVIFRKEPRTGAPGKLNKVPLHWQKGIPASPHNPEVWVHAFIAETMALVKGPDYGVGFVLTEGCGFAVIDVDDCHDPETGKLSPVARELVDRLKGAYIEVSLSGRGIHIWFTYRGAMPEHGCRKAAHGLEFYTAGRFIALGSRYRESGSGCADLTDAIPALIAGYFPPSATALAGDPEWTTKPCEGWSGPADDEVLIERAKRRESAEAVFSGRASFEDLWGAKEGPLGKTYPDANGRAFNASSADAALAQHLAFWTGKDCSRIERLMRKSELRRDKYEREDYLRRTILQAVARQDRVLGEERPLRRQRQMTENRRIGEGEDESPAAEVLSQEDMLSRYCYVFRGKRVVDWNIPRRDFSLDEWKSGHRASRSEVEKGFNADGSKKIKQVDTTALWEMDPARKQVDALTFRPGASKITLDPDGHKALNSWIPIERLGPAGDASLFVRHVEYLFGNDAPALLDWLAHIEQQPGVLPHSGWVHVSPMQGTGRNWLSGVLCRLWSGYVASNFDLSETLRTGFNGALSRKLLAVVDEINEGGSDGRWGNAEKLKSLVTSEHRFINPKYGHQTMEYNVCRWLIFSNHTSALPITGEDRRFNVVRNDHPPMPENYYMRLYSALDDPAFINAVAAHLSNRDLAAFNSGAHARLSEAKQAMIAASKSESDERVADLIANHPADVITNSELGRMLTDQPFGKLTSHHRHALERAGAQAYGKTVRVGPLSGRISILRNHSFWKVASVPQIQVELTRATSTGVTLSFAEFAETVSVN